MENIFKQITWKMWGVAALVWFVVAFLFSGTMVFGYVSLSFMGIISIQWLLSTGFLFLRGNWSSLSFLIQMALLILFCPLVSVPLLAVFLSRMKEKMQKRPNLKAWIISSGIWYIATSVMVMIYYLKDAALSRTSVFEAASFLVFGPLKLIAVFLSGPFTGEMEIRSAWFLSLAVSPFIWIPIIHWMIKRWTMKKEQKTIRKLK